MSRKTADALADVFKAIDQKGMIEISTVYDASIPSHLNERYLEETRRISEEWEPELRRKIDKIIADGKNA